MNKAKPLDQVCLTGAVTPDVSAKVLNNFESNSTIFDKLKEFARSVSEFRRTDRGNLRHKLCDMIMLVLLARICGCVGRCDIIEFGRYNLRRFQSMGILKNGVPSEPTLCRMEQGIDDLSMAKKMSEFIASFRRELNPSGVQDIISIDGKAMRGTVQSNGRNPDIVSAYSGLTGLTLATVACSEKSNEIKAGPVLLGDLNIAGDIITADAMSMQKDIIDKIREKNADFVIELKANQRTLRYGIEDRIGRCKPAQEYTEGPELSHGRIETRSYKVYDGEPLIADKKKWGGRLTVVEVVSETINKSTGMHMTERRFFVSSLPPNARRLGAIIRQHWMIEASHWILDRNFWQDRIKRKSAKAARNLDTLQRIAYAVFSIWRGRRKKLADKAKGVAELMRGISMSFTRLMRFLSQK